MNTLENSKGNDLVQVPYKQVVSFIKNFMRRRAAVMIETVNMTKYFGSFKALDNLSISRP